MTALGIFRTFTLLCRDVRYSQPMACLGFSVPIWLYAVQVCANFRKKPMKSSLSHCNDW